MKTRTDAVVFTTLKNKDIITTDSNGHIMLDVTKLFDTDGSEFLKCRNVGDYTVGEIEKLKYKLKTLIYGKAKNDGRGRLGGRAAGTPNKVTGTLKSWITDLINCNRSQMEKDLKNLDPKDRLMFLEKMMQYVIPKQAAQQVKLDFDSLTDEQLQQIINDLAKEVENENSD